MKVLFIHQNFPGQFKHIALHLVRQPGVEVLAIGRDSARGLPGVGFLHYTPQRQAGASTHAYIRTFENAVLHGQEVLRLLMELKGKGYQPDVVVAHPGWGEALYVKEVFPQTRLIHFCEYYYHSHGADSNFDPEFPLTINEAASIRTRNALHLLNLEQCDAGVTPTHWQHALHPQAYQDKIKVVHEGIDIKNLGPDPRAVLELADGTIIKAGDPVITYVARNLEPYRGFHSFMRALPELLARHPTCQVLIVGGDSVSYGRPPKDAANWRSKLLSENPLDLNRVHFLGKIPYEAYKVVLQVSAAHVYLTYPFVLSWSLLEAMACGCLIIGSDTAPVREVINHEQNGLLVDFFDSAKITELMLDALEHPEKHQLKRVNAQTSVQKYGVEAGLKRYLELLGLQEYCAQPDVVCAS